MWLLMEFTRAQWEIAHMSETNGEKEAEIANCWPSVADGEISMVTAGQGTTFLLSVSTAWTITVSYGWIIWL